MQAQEYLLKIMRLKQAALQKHLGVEDYFTEADQEEILSWSEDECQGLLHKMYLIGAVGTAQCCPWCRKYASLCGECTYATRHKSCGAYGSTYRMILDHLPAVYETFIELPGLRTAIYQLIFVHYINEPWYSVKYRKGKE